MKRSFATRLVAALVVSACCLGSTAFAALNAYLKIEGIRGGAVQSPGAIDVIAYSWGVSNSGSAHSGGGAGAGKANFQDLSLTIPASRATPALMEACAKGTFFPRAELIVSSTNKKSSDYLKFELENVLVTSYATGGSEADQIPVENLTLNFSVFKFTYFAAGEPISFQFDLAENRTE